MYNTNIITNTLKNNKNNKNKNNKIIISQEDDEKPSKYNSTNFAGHTG